MNTRKTVPEEIQIALRRNSINVISNFIKDSGNVDAKESDGWPMLITAAYYGHAQIVQMLIEKGADVNVANSSSSTALIQASWNGHLKVVRILLDAGADTECKNNKGQTALMCAVMDEHHDVVKVLINAGAFVDTWDSNGDTAICVAKRWNCDHEMVRILIEAGVNLESITPTDAEKQGYKCRLGYGRRLGYSLPSKADQERRRNERLKKRAQLYIKEKHEDYLKNTKNIINARKGVAT